MIVFFALVFWRIVNNAYIGDTNFETLFGLGLSILLMSHFIIHVGMNIGLLPITGISLPFLSYGGSHTITVLLGLGIQMGMRKYGYASGSTRLDEDMIPQYRYL